MQEQLLKYLVLPFGKFGTYTEYEETQAAHLEKLQSLDTLKEKLQYWNSEIKSLALSSSKGEQLYLKFASDRKAEKIFCLCDNCQQRKPVSNQDKQTFFNLRATEVARLFDALEAIPDYGRKLDYLLSVKGFSYHFDLRAYPNYNPLSSPQPIEDDYPGTPPVFDLNPYTPEQKEVYNHKFENYLLSEWQTNEAFNTRYPGSCFLAEAETYKQALPNADDPRHLVASLMKEIEKGMNYKQESAATESQSGLAPLAISSHIRQQIEAVNGPRRTIHYYFKMLANGFTINYTEKTFLEDDVLTVTHARQVFSFYTWLKSYEAIKQELTSTVSTEKLNWTGQKNVLYHVIRQLKEKDLIRNSYNSLANFLIQNVLGFQNTSKETIEKELKKSTLPAKPKRINLDLNSTE